MEDQENISQHLAVPLARRSFLKRSLFAGLGLAILSWSARLAVVPVRVMASADGVKTQLPENEFHTLEAVVLRLLPTRHDAPNGAVLAVAKRIDNELRYQPKAMTRDLRDALRLIEWLPLFTLFGRFSSLSELQQDQFLQHLSTSRFALFRSAFMGVKWLAMFFYYTQDETWPAIAYDGPWVKRSRPATLA